MLELRDVRAGYGDTTVLWDVTVTVPPSSVVALLGPNGAGKTTLLRVASGLLEPHAGRVLLDERDLGADPPHARAEAGLCLVPEGRGIFPSLTVAENLALQVRAGQEASAVERAVAAFPVLGARLDQQAGTLSGGERQMLALARAYVRDSRYLLLDEVSMGLAPQLVDAVFASLERLTAAGAALLLVEQYAQRALAVADYAYVLTNGRLSFVGEPAELEDGELFQRYLGA